MANPRVVPVALTAWSNDRVIVAGGATKGPRAHMQDTHAVALDLGPKFPEAALYAVFDGHDGDDSAVYCANHFVDRVRDAQSLNDSDLIQTIDEFDLEILKTVRSKNENARRLEDAMNKCTAGTTAVIALSIPAQAAADSKAFPPPAAASDDDKKAPVAEVLKILNIGDSRALIVRADGTWEALTTDHKPHIGDERKRVERAGGVLKDTKVHVGDKLQHWITLSRALGDGLYKSNPNVPRNEQVLICTPDITFTNAVEGDCLVLGSDGLFENSNNEAVAQLVAKKLKQHADLNNAVKEVVEVRGQTSNDNITVLLVVFKKPTVVAM